MVSDGMTCRDFLASYVRRQGAETWMQGEACRAKTGRLGGQEPAALVAVLSSKRVAVEADRHHI